MSETTFNNSQFLRWRQYGRRIFWPIFWTLFFILLIVLVVHQSQEFSNCIHDGKNAEYYKAVNKSVPIFHYFFEINRRRASLYTGCVGIFIDKNNGPLTAIATIAVAAFTLVLWIATSRQARLTRESIDFSNRAFVASHRPRLRIRRISLDGLSARDIPLIDGGKVECIISISNIGGSTATIVQGRYRIYYTRMLPRGPDIFEGKAVSIAGIPITLEAGRNIIITLGDTLPDQDTAMGQRLHYLQVDLSSPGRDRLFVVGNIWYRDELGISRAVGFCRELHSDYRFRPVKDSDCEYED